jgi:hypothetical protein
MFLRFQKAAVRGNYGTGNQAFSMHLRFLTIRVFNILAILAQECSSRQRDLRRALGTIGVPQLAPLSLNLAAEP